MTRGRPISPETGRRLTAWQTGCARGWSTAEIAATLDIPVTTLQQTVYRARRRGDDRAVYHPAARFAGDGIAFLVRADTRASRSRRKRRERQHATLRKAHHQTDNTE